MDTSELKIEILESVNITEDVMENFFENIAEDIENFESFEFEPQSFEDEYLYTLPGHWMVEMNPIFGLFDMTAYNASDSKPGVNISQKNRNYSVWEGNETYKISKTFPKFKKKIGIIPTTFVLI